MKKDFGKIGSSMEPTDEQKRQLNKLKIEFGVKTFFAIVLYGIFYFFAELSIHLLDVFYVHDQQFTSAAWLGTFLIVMFGLSETVQEAHDILISETEKVLNNQ